MALVLPPLQRSALLLLLLLLLLMMVTTIVPLLLPWCDLFMHLGHTRLLACLHTLRMRGRDLVHLLRSRHCRVTPALRDSIHHLHRLHLLVKVIELLCSIAAFESAFARRKRSRRHPRLLQLRHPPHRLLLQLFFPLLLLLLLLRLLLLQGILMGLSALQLHLRVQDVLITGHLHCLHALWHPPPGLNLPCLAIRSQ